MRLDIPVLLDRFPLGDVSASISSQEELLGVDGPGFLRLVDRFLLMEKVAAIRQRIRPSGQLTREDLAAEGITLIFDAARVEARLEVPIEVRTTQSLSLTRPYGAEVVDLTGPAAVSGYVNFLAGKDYIQEGAGKPPLVTDFDGAINVLGNALEGVATFRDNGDVRWQRGDVRLVHDEVESRTRFVVGDIPYGLDGFQSFQRAGGIAVSRNFGLQPYRSSAPVGQTQLNLDRNARVDVLVNGQRMRTLDLAPGRYNVRDFPLIGGTNDVTLRITDEVGRVDVIRFPFVFDSTVLAAGEQDFGYAVGAPSRTTKTGRNYNDGDRVISAFHSYGFTDQLTLGLNYQGSRDINVVGTEGRLATRIGTFRADAAMSDATFAGTGAAARLQHRWNEQPGLDSDNRSLVSTITYRSIPFVSLGQKSASNPTAIDTGIVYGQRLTDGLYGSIGAARQFGRSGQPSVNSVDVNFSMPLADDVTTSLLLGTRQASSGGNDNRIFFSISWFPHSTGQRFGTSFDTAEHTRRVDWSYTPTTRVDSVQADLSVIQDRSNNQLQGDVGYTGYRFTSSVYQTTTRPRDDGRGHSQRSTLNFGTALAFADGHVAVSRPISDSFAMFVPHPTLSGQGVEINRVGNTPEAQTDFLGPAVLPELSSYYQRHVIIDAPDLPLGYDLGRQVYDISPTYRSGISIPVGTGATVLADGILVDADGKPLTLEPGRIEALDAPNRPAVEFFTSRTGRFRVEGLSPGTYRLILANEPEQAITFSVPSNANGLFQLGTLTYPVHP